MNILFMQRLFRILIRGDLLGRHVEISPVLQFPFFPRSRFTRLNPNLEKSIDLLDLAESKNILLIYNKKVFRDYVGEDKKRTGSTW